MRLRTQVLVLQAALVTAALAVVFGVFAVVSVGRSNDEYGQRALAIAQAVAADPEVRAGVAEYALSDAAGTERAPASLLAAGPLQRAVEAARERTGALFIVVTDDRGIRLGHPDPTVLGQRVSTDPSRPLAGEEIVELERGTLGDSIRAKVPVRDPVSEPTVVGEVSVGISTAAVRTALIQDLVFGALAIGAVLGLGLGGAVLLARRWKRLTLGLEPEELTELVREQEAVLHGIGEGVVATDTRGHVTVVNDEARTLLGVDGASGSRIEEIGLTERLLDVVRSASAEPVLASAGDRVVIASARTVTRDNRRLGTVLTVRDRTDVDALTRQLDAVQTMSAALRAQRHEFANRLHLVSGLLHGGRPDRAAEYIDEILDVHAADTESPDGDAVADPYLTAFLAAKFAHARESGVRLALGDNTSVTGTVADSVDVTTVLGNLIDNAVYAARTGRHDSPVVEVELLQEDSTLHIVVTDSGDGLALDADSVFSDGVSSKPSSEPGGRGLGLHLARQIARSRGGDIVVADAGGTATAENPLGGAMFVARLPRSLVPVDPDMPVDPEVTP